MDVMVRRAHGLVERFKSRSDLMRINPNPPGLMTGGHWDQLNQAIWHLFSSKAQTDVTYERKISLWKTIFLYIRVSIYSLNHYEDMDVFKTTNLTFIMAQNLNLFSDFVLFVTYLK